VPHALRLEPRVPRLPPGGPWLEAGPTGENKLPEREARGFINDSAIRHLIGVSSRMARRRAVVAGFLRGSR